RRGCAGRRECSPVQAIPRPTAIRRALLSTGYIAAIHRGDRSERGGGPMSTRAEVLELAILGQLGSAPMHGYELRRQLSAQLGAFRTLSYGSLYPALRRLTEAGLIAEAPTASLPHPLAGRRGRIVYELTAAGRERLAATLATADPAAWEDEAFDVRFTLFATTDA